MTTDELCPDCKNPAHEPGMSEFSNCGESDISHSRYDDVEPLRDPSYKDDYVVLNDSNPAWGIGVGNEARQ